eukprot:scaffold1338_cov121-Cylindrotheca_fusiformis.AAC.2
MATSSSRPRDALTSSAPLYITIGPQCCGKTTFLKEKLKAQDISLDDQPDVYVPVPTQLWLDSYYRAASNNSTTQQQEIPLLLQQRVQGKSIHDRMIQDNTELNLILQRWDGRLSPQNFAIGILQHYASLRPMNGNTANSTAIRMGHMLVQVVEAFLSSSTPPKLPEQTQVFCLESLFRPHEQTKQSAIQRAHAMLRQAPSHIPIAWGNTNSKGKDYQQALEIACQTRRPVYFVLSHPSSSCQLELSLPWIILDDNDKNDVDDLKTTTTIIIIIIVIRAFRNDRDSQVGMIHGEIMITMALTKIEGGQQTMVVMVVEKKKKNGGGGGGNKHHGQEIINADIMTTMSIEEGMILIQTNGRDGGVWRLSATHEMWLHRSSAVSSTEQEKTFTSYGMARTIVWPIPSSHLFDWNRTQPFPDTSCTSIVKRDKKDVVLTFIGDP